MWIVSLDEGGRFEKNDLNRVRAKCNMVGGTIFKCNGPAQAEKETNRLMKFLSAVCAEQGGVFPRDLHPGFDIGFQTADTVNAIKKALARELPDFCRGTGRWAVDPPCGMYELYAIVGDREGIQSLSQMGRSNLISDDVASNRYEHMAYRGLQNLLFFNPHSDDDDVRLDLATRAMNPADAQSRQEQVQLGARQIQTRDGKLLYSVTDVNSYRAMLLQTMLDNRRTDLVFDLNVQKICYTQQSPEQAFLYLADTVCSIYQDAVWGAQNSGEALARLIEKSNEIVGPGHGHFWAYHAVDLMWRDLYRAYERYDDYEAFSQIVKIRERLDAYAKAYDILWLREIEKRIIATHKPSAYAVSRLNEYLDDPSYKLATAKAILEMFRKQCAGIEWNERNTQLLHELSRAETTVYNHEGNYTAAAEACRKAISMAQYLPVEDYLDLRNMMTVAQLDSRDIDQAVETANGTVEYAQFLSNIKDEIFAGARDNHILLGRSLSQLGQCYSFAGLYDEAIRCFTQAIDTFGTNIGEAQKTRSYYLHALIEAGDAEAYDREAAVYFGCSGLQEQYNAIFKLNETSAKFALYVYVKALYFLKRNTLPKKFVNDLSQDLAKHYKEAPDFHPWEMILKYCALLQLTVIARKGNTTADGLIKRAAAAVKESEQGILPMIVQQAQKQYEHACKGDQDIFADSVLTYMYR